MHLGERAPREAILDSLATVGTGRTSSYLTPVPCGTESASSNTFTTQWWIWDPTFRATINHRNLTSGRDLEGEIAEDFILAATRIIGIQGIISFIINLYISITISISISSCCNSNFYYWFALVFIHIHIFIPYAYGDVVDCFHEWVVYLVLGDMEKP
jgi:hypothetical protein